HEPWNGLGLYNKIELKTEWQTFNADFQSNATDENARIHFDLGESGIPVEISSVQLLKMPEASSTEKDTRFSVEYRFNKMGCRGPDYQIPKPSGTKRILVLGDSSALGAGVNED